MRISGYHLENTFLTKANTVGMQWVKKNGDQFTIWIDHKGALKTTSSAPIPVEVYERALDWYESKLPELVGD